MKVNLRFCLECKRDTIQAQTKGITGTGYGDCGGYKTYSNVWYCPQCGKKWRVQKKNIEEELKEEP